MTKRQAVRIEVRAATIAAQMINEMHQDMTAEELNGWMRRGDGRERGSRPESPAWQAGWLAAHIFSEHEHEVYARHAASLGDTRSPLT